MIYHQIISAPEKPDIVVFGSLKIYDNRQKINLINTEPGFYNRAKMEKEIFPRLIHDPQQIYGEAIFLPTSWNKAFKYELLKNHHCFDERIRLGEDNAYVFECLLNAKSIVVCKEILYYYYRLNSESILSKYDVDRLKNRVFLFQYVQTRLAGYGSVIDQQMDNFYASRIIYDIYFIYNQSTDIFKTGKYLSRELRETKILKYVHLGGIPFRERIFILLLKLGLCRITLLGLKILRRTKNLMSK